jgi:hypothetical protein
LKKQFGQDLLELLTELVLEKHAAQVQALRPKTNDRVHATLAIYNKSMVLIESQ